MTYSILQNPTTSTEAMEARFLGKLSEILSNGLEICGFLCKKKLASIAFVTKITVPLAGAFVFDNKLLKLIHSCESWINIFTLVKEKGKPNGFKAEIEQIWPEKCMGKRLKG